ncbi:hypothetical protein BKA70DRAFT_1341888 [Coprinopsis sp. MPI-PUGE-AT-0042]|nr:hypothetical protein BKA70DRAFT_1341888 [Coprinopsis sp. MPI-PUGE-AT-0042]
MEACQNSFGLLERPPGLTHYASTNEPLPPGGLLMLDGYLAQLSIAIQNLEGDIKSLLSVVDAKKSEKRRLQQERETCSIMKSPIRRLPPEVLGIIFTFAVGFPPFNRFVDVTRLRGVCSVWRRTALTAPGLWTSLRVTLENWPIPEISVVDDDALLCQFKEQFAPWLAILSRTPPYHLTLTSTLHEDSNIDEAEKAQQIQLARYLLAAMPQPGTVTLASFTALLGTKMLALSQSVCSAAKLELDDGSGVLGEEDMPDLQQLGSAFPNLEALRIDSPFCAIDNPPFRHSVLQTLHIDNVRDLGIPFQKIMQQLPSLRELNLSARFGMDGDARLIDPHTHFAHSSLEILILQEEDMILMLQGISFPCLRFLSTHGEGFESFEDAELDNGVLLTIFARSSSEPLFVSISGAFFQPLLARLVQSLPPNTNLYLDIWKTLPRIDDDINESEGEDSEGEQDSRRSRRTIPFDSDNIQAIFVGRHGLDLWWLPTGRNERCRPLRIHLPADYADFEHGSFESLEQTIQGFDIVPSSNRLIGDMLLSLVPRFSKYSTDWWVCDLIRSFH